MIVLLEERIRFYKNKLLEALDSDDPISALKYRAIQKELEALLDRLSTKDTITISSDQYFTTDEASKLLKLHPSSLTRKANSLKGIMYKGKWYFPKSVIVSQLEDKKEGGV